MECLIQQPRTLESLATDEIADWILLKGKLISDLQQHDAAKAEELISLQIELIRNYLENRLPNKFYDQLATNLTVSLNKLERSVEFRFSQKLLIGRMIETVFSKNLTCLSLCSEIFFASLSKSFLLPALVDLTFSPCSWSGDVNNIEKDTIQFLKELHNLKYLNLSYCSGICCVDNILNCIAANCKSIEVLNVCYLECFNDESVEILARLKNLRRVDLRETAVSEKGIESLLMSCDNIEYVITDENEVALALENIADENPEKEFKLISYENCRETTLEQFQLVVKTCPLIQKMSVTKYEALKNYLLTLNQAKNLRKLELYGHEFYVDHVGDVLRERGQNLVHLHLEDVEQIDLEALLCISQTCPNLESLTLEDCRFEKQSLKDVFHTTKPMQKPLFNNLKKLFLTRLGNLLATQLGEEQLFFLLSSCPNIEFICASLVDITDDVILKVLDSNPWIFLEELKLRHQERPASLVIDRIIQNCHNISKVSVCEKCAIKSGKRNSIDTSSIHSML